VKCENCGNEYTPSGDEYRCPFCGQIPGMNIGPEGKEAYGADKAEARGNCAWERRSSWFDLQAIIEMIRNVLVDPVTTFKQMKLSGDMASPLVFVLVLGSVGLIVNLFWNILLEGFQYLPFRHGAEEFFISTGMKVVFMVFSPILVLIGTFISAGILHISLPITGGRKERV
jgi:hypothetical protein